MPELTPEEAHAEAVRRIRECISSGQPWLDLGDLELTELPEELGECQQLEWLILGKWKVNIGEKVIDLKRNFGRPYQQFSDINVLKSLINLSFLDLSFCSKLTNVDGLQGLTNLNTLDLSFCSKLTNVDGLQELTNLNTLDLSFCTKLTTVDVLAGMANLTTLDLTRCVVLTSASVLQRLNKLEKLSLSECIALNEFAELFRFFTRLKKLWVYHTRFRDLHPAVCGSDPNFNAIESVRQYYAALELEGRQQPDAEIKVFLLGNGRAGKSYLVRRLLGETWEQIEAKNIMTTHGVQIETYDVPWEEWGLPHPVKLCIWDFGGQDIYHGTHALFLREPAIYLLLTSKDTEDEREISDNGFIIKNRKLPYWFDYLRQEAGSRGVVHSPVLLIQSQCDKDGNLPEPDSRPSQDEFQQLSPIIHTSAKESRGLKHLMPRIEDAITSLLNAHPQPPLPTSWAKVRQAIRDMQKKNEPRALTQQEFATLCEEHDCGENAAVLRDALHLMGAVFYRNGIFGDRIIVDQSWVLENIYDVCKRDEKFQTQLRRQNGRFTRSDLHHYVWQEKNHSIEDEKLFLSFMRECGICFLVSGEVDKDTAEYIAPDILPSEHAGLRNWIRLADRDAVGVNVKYGLLHDGLIRNFLCRIGTFAKDIADYWKYGCHLYDAKSESDVLIRTEGNSIRLQAWGERPKELLTNLLEILSKVPAGQKPRVSWADDAQSPVLLEAKRENEDQPDANIDARFGPKSVFFSYRHPKAEIPSSERGRALLTELEAILKPQGWTVKFDIRDIDQGDSISRFIEQVRACAFFVPIFCEHYLDSKYTLSELFTFREKFGHDGKAFADRTMTVAYPESGIQDDIKQGEYVLKCGSMFDKYFEMAGKKALAPQTYAKVVYLNSWAGRLSEILASLNDRLNSPNAELLAERLNTAYTKLNPSR